MENTDGYKALNAELFSRMLEIFGKTYYVTTDSRKVKKDCIFVALQGEKFNGNKFAVQALNDGAAVAIIDDKDYYVDDRTVLVEDSLLFLQRFARYYRDTWTIPVIAISGTNGKTTTKELIKAVLETKYRVYATQGNLNNQIGVPLTVLSVKPDCQIAVIEMGASHEGDIDELCNIADPDAALLTNIGIAHIEGFGSQEAIIRTKTELYRYVNAKKGKVFVNTDDTNLLKNSPDGALTYSLHDKAEVRGETVVREDNYACIRLHGEEIRSHLVGAYNCYNILASATVGLYYNITKEDIKKAVGNYYPDNNRSQIKKTKRNTLVMDCYNANLSSCLTALESFKLMHSSDKRVFIGAMKELGSVSVQAHSEIAKVLSDMNLTQVILVGEEYAQSAKEYGFDWFATSKQACVYLSKENIQGALILIKGSRSTEMELLADVL